MQAFPHKRADADEPGVASGLPDMHPEPTLAETVQQAHGRQPGGQPASLNPALDSEGLPPVNRRARGSRLIPVLGMAGVSLVSVQEVAVESPR